MSASRASRALMLALLAAGWLGSAAAQDRINVEDLTIRAQAGDKAATRQLAEAFYVGRGGVQQDFSEAARWYLVLAQQGDARAQTSIGLMYARGYGVKKDLAQALRWWSFAAAQNDAGAQYNLGLLYSLGEDVEQDYSRALDWYRKAASRGHVQAQHNLGMLYHGGKGTERDPVRAYFWVKVAATQGDVLARESLATVAAALAPDEIGQADRQVEEWLRKARRVWQ